MIWRTTFGDEVTSGDVVALGILSNPDAVGRIVGPGRGGRVECLLGDFDDPNRTRPKLEVEAYQLRMLLRKGREVQPKVPSDHTRSASPSMRDPQTENDTDDTTTAEGGEVEATQAA